MVVAVGLGILMLLAAISTPSFVKARNTSQQNVCINNLRCIDACKEVGAMAYRLTDGHTIATVSVNEYMSDKILQGNDVPTCPAGGTYTYNPIGVRPECSIETPTSHELP